MRSALLALRSWDRRRWVAAALSGVAIAVLVALPTAVIPNPVFGRAIAVTWWSYPVVAVTAVLGGLLVGTYVRVMDKYPDASDPDARDRADNASRLGMAGGLLTFFAVGCPVCNKLVLLALGATGAITWFAPVQPVLAIASLAFMAIALRARLIVQITCPVSITTGK